MFSYEIKIPRDRVAVLIGKKGYEKRQLEKATETRLTIDSSEGEVTIAGEDGVKLYAAQQVVRAVARGFNPDVALRLLKQDWSLELIDLSDYSTRQNQQQRLKGRVIGQGGKSRKVIEDLSESSISIYGKTVGIIAPADTMQYAKRAVEMILEGAKHSTVYRWLELKRRDLKRHRVMGSTTARFSKDRT